MKIYKKKIVKSLLFVLIVSVIGYGAYSYFYPELEQQKQKGISWIVTEFFEEDILFFSELAPALCDNKGDLSIFFKGKGHISPLVGLSHYSIVNPNIGKDRMKYLVEILENLKGRLHKLSPTNDFQKKLKNNLIDATSDMDFNKLLNAKSEKEYEKMEEEVSDAFWKSGGEQYYNDIVSRSVEGLNELPLFIRFSFGVLGSDYSLSDKKHLLKVVNQIAQKNQNYLDAYNSGCLKLFITELEKSIEFENLVKDREKTKLAKIFEKILK